MTDKQFSRGHVTVALWNAKNPVNAGGVFRAGACWGVDLVVLSGTEKRLKGLMHTAADTTRAWRHMPVIQVEDPFQAVPIGSIPIAVDLIPGAVSLPHFEHPERAYYIFGPEDGTLPDRIHSRCKYVVSAPTFQCMNLAAAVNVFLYDRAAKIAAKNYEYSAAA